MILQVLGPSVDLMAENIISRAIDIAFPILEEQKYSEEIPAVKVIVDELNS